ncbi:MAG: hypothetical protein KF730_14935 [Sphingomonas sp.]|uniref:hypothetical protein n=1 Tax=Sphingomonas sp. TaxID=28214 RepID=UPI0025D9134A|nr:hypothetical protein [Sphingomonas sp.]MBX3565862.1 hypothetical protein [Sphingomonas sp.]
MIPAAACLFGLGLALAIYKFAADDPSALAADADLQDFVWRLPLTVCRGGGEQYQCRYQAAPDQPLALRFKSPLYRCTLPAPEQKMCRQTFVAGSSGQIVIKKRD